MTLRPRHAFAVLLLLSLALDYYFFAVLIPRARELQSSHHQAGGYGYGNDFYQIWITTRELLEHRTDPYTPGMQQRIEIGLYGRPLDRRQKADAIVPYRGYSYPLIANVVAAPLGLLSFQGVQVILSLLLPCSVLASLLLWCLVFQLHPSLAEFAVIGVLSLSALPVLEGIYALQPTLLSAALIAASVLLLQKSRLAWAGVVLAIGWAKPQLIIVLAAWLALWAVSDWTQRKAFLIAFAITSATLFAISEAWLPGWWREWLSSLSAYRQVNSPPLLQLVLGNAIGQIAAVCAFGILIVAAIRWRRERAEARAFVLATVLVLATTVVTISSSIAVYDQFLLLPAVSVLWVERGSLLDHRLTRFVIILTAVAFLWPWIAAPMVSFIHLIALPSISARIILLPLVMASSFPLLLMVALAMVMARRLRRGAAETSTVASHEVSLH
jgi:hypothetical protein